jgi:hypothetical protein
MSDSVEGISVAPATPSSARAAINIAALVEKAASTEAAAKPVAPISNSRATTDPVAQAAHRQQLDTSGRWFGPR